MKTIHPKGLYFLFAVEMWERFSYYGMRALLTLYMVKYLLFSTEKAGSVYGWYTGLVYLTPLIGGYIADRYLGQKKCILYGAILMIIGQFALAIPDLKFFYIALSFLILGNGLFKPNISTMVGQLYKKNDERRDGGFTIFYMGINLGAFLAPLICGTLGEKIGFHWGFAAAGVGMIIGLVTFIVGKEKFCTNVGNKTCHQIKVNNVDSCSVPLTKEEKSRVAVIFILMFFSIFFWAAFEQAGSSLTLFADRSANRVIPFINWEFPVSYFQSVNPLLILIFAPLFSSLWIKLAKTNKNPSAPLKFGIGLLLVSLGFLLIMLAYSLFGVDGKISFVWLIGVYLFHTLGELCISPVGLSVVTKLAPIKFASLLMGTWFLASFFANKLAGDYAGTYDTVGVVEFFTTPAVLTASAGIIALLLAKKITNWMYGVE